MLSNVWIATIATFGFAVAWLRFCDLLAQRGILSSPTSRKIIHIGTGPVFVLCWLLFPESPLSRYLAALVPLLITGQFFLVGIGVVKDPAAVKAMSRTGDKKEILRGPLFYGIVFILVTIFYWKTTPSGVIALMILCGGDGLADLVGKSYGKHPLPWSTKKTWQGSIGMLAGGLILSIFVVGVFSLVGVFSYPVEKVFLGILLLSLAATLVETLPFQDIDNLTVPAIVILVGYFIF
jgi:phytol kinase